MGSCHNQCLTRQLVSFNIAGCYKSVLIEASGKFTLDYKVFSRSRKLKKSHCSRAAG